MAQTESNSGMHQISTEDITIIIENKTFPKHMTAGKSIIILTQSWCPQWSYMKNYLPQFASKNKVSVYFIEYDKNEKFQEIMGFKESTFSNDEVPYCRYYLDGKFVQDSNFVYEDDIMNYFNTK